MEKKLLKEEELLDQEQEPPSLSDLQKFPKSDKVEKFRKKYFPEVSNQQWNDWHWQISNSFLSIDDLSKFLKLSSDEKNVIESQANLPIRITPYYASLISSSNPLYSLRRTVVPTIDELKISQGEAQDPLSEHQMQKTNCIVHRYPDRVLFLVTDFCSVYCRYCTRSHSVAKHSNHNYSMQQWLEAIEYIKKNKKIRDVLISGGDPLTQPDNKLDFLLAQLQKIKHVEIIRIGTKVPVVLPQRITPELVNMLKKYHPLFLSIHFTHPEEITKETKLACNMLADAGIPMGSQTVLLKGINDNAEIYKKLAHELLKIRVKPYYLYQCDPIEGSAHFRTSIEKGIEIMQKLRGFTSGYAIPYYVVDAPGGGGKIPLLPDYFQGKDKDGNVVLKNFEDKLFKYPDYL